MSYLLAVGKEAYQMLEKTVYVLRALALRLGLDESILTIMRRNSILRPYSLPSNHLWTSMLFVLLLMVTSTWSHYWWERKVYKFKPQRWLDWCDAEPDELVINVGDMLSRHTNNKLKSTIHQVNPPRELWGTSRYSVPFFMHPVRHAIKLFRKLYWCRKP
jgi:isopenicillin N synthase-like dioxygenase